MKTAIAMIVALAACLLSTSHGQECSKSSLSEAAQEQLDIYDKDLYLEPACVDGTVPLPVHCNYMGLGQECRGCYMTCEGALKYMDDFPQEIVDWGVDAIINFCPSSDVDSIDHC